MRNVWFFGDSFTEGWSTKKIEQNIITGQEQYFTEVLGSRGNKWTEQTAQFLNGTEKNHGTGGSSNERIIFTIINHLKYIKPGDAVIMSNSHELRFPIPDSSGHGITDFNAGRLAEKGLEEYHKIHLPQDKNKVNTLVDYALDFRVAHENLWRENFLLAFSWFEEYFRSIQVECYFWEYSIWMYDSEHKFERIHTATNNRIFDLHFSQKGHDTFFSYFLDNINTFTLQNFKSRFFFKYE